jgi:epoxyqueuosine reductase
MMSIESEIKDVSKENGFQLFGVADISDLEKMDFPDGRGMEKPSDFMKRAKIEDAKSIIVLGMVIWDEGMNSAINASGGDFSGGGAEYYNLYYETLETRGWRISEWISREKGFRTVRAPTVHLKLAAYLAGLGFICHNTQVITPEYGPRVRWIALFTTANLKKGKPFDRDLCAEQPLCKKESLCVKSCPYHAIIPGPSKGVEPGKKVDYDGCVVAHEFDPSPDIKWEKYIRRITERGFMECTICNRACPYGKIIDDVIAPMKNGKT